MNSLPMPPRLLSVREAAQAMPEIDGRKPHHITVYRWAVDGTGPDRLRLRHVRIGNRIGIPADAIPEFLDQLTTAYERLHEPNDEPPRPMSPNARQKAIDAAMARLQARGTVGKG